MAKTVVVTGAGRGIGQATALLLARRGLDVIGTVRTAEKADRLRAAARAQGTGLRTVLLDLRDPEGCVRAMDACASMAGGTPWALVNNAAIALAGAVADPAEERIREILEVNVLAPARLARLLLPGMRARHAGRIVNVSSVAGRLSTPFFGWYCASKHALKVISHALRMEERRHGIAVVLVEPGIVDTGIWSRSVGRLEEQRNSPFAEQYAQAGGVVRAASRRPGPERVAHAVHRALAAPHPHARYPVGHEARWLPVLESLTPLPLRDYAKEVALGLRDAPPGVRDALRYWRTR
ncbi:SDR family NAD(P)-dependent oxidoreductase [Streptomyces sp. SP18CS02]|uniref:SDR family NAD(P)-dependent oxidoreductase n=1 Tax=Streptomyces sp. SP18CS02 TaxID=3002531 RepID=UPI002E7A6BC3|nr:SDR family NAD(P)-dependent oxidoreductase [Streptomyces sp. SP18CS02]MEE1756910.1 SDR family NAD(P)-dependent oxidoreductase [Streptomyces sp. SP18CS02]